MIQLNRLIEMLMDLRADANAANTEADSQIDHLLICPTESNLLKKIKDKKGIILAAKLPDADSNISNIDNKTEENHMLIFLFEKQDPGKVDDNSELKHYAKMQKIMSFIKNWIAERGLNGNVCGGDETLSSKQFHTEWEYQAYSNHNGLSITFDLKDFGL